MIKKTDDCSSCQNLNKRLKVLQADYDFQIKKISQDKSTEKALLQLNTNREIKKLQEKCLKQKQQRAKQNQLWMTKYDQLIEKQKLQITQYKLQKDKEAQDFKKTKNQELQKFKKDTVTKLQQKIQTLIVQKDQLRAQLTQNHQREISDLKKSHEDKIKKLVQTHQQNINKKSQQYEATILGVQSQKNVEENLHRKTKEESKDAQSRLNQQIYSLKRNIFQLDQKIVTLKSQIQEKCHKIQILHGQMIKMQNDFTEKQQKLLKEYDQKYESHKKSMENKLEQLFKKELQNCTKYQKALQKIQQQRQIENQMYKANLSEIKGCVEQRPSRLEDIEEIIKLREKLNKKERQCQSLTQELKYYRLQLQNKEETYNKIFGPESKNTQSIMIRRKDLKMKRAGKSVSTVRQVLGSANINPNILAPLVGNLEKKFLPPKQNKIL